MGMIKETIEQPYKKIQSFGKVPLILYITLLQMFGMFSTDMYSPALPVMAEYFATSESTVNLSLLVFFVFQLVGMLLSGPISDRYGRKPLLLAGTLIYVSASIGCTLAYNVWALIIWRVFQALACGSAITVGTAIVKDSFNGKLRETMFMVVQAVFVIGPIIAPVIGGQMTTFFSWRAIFVILTALGVLGFIMTIFFKESLQADERTTGSILQSFNGLIIVAQNKRFMKFLLVATAFIALPFSTYLTVSPYIYEEFFGLSPIEFSYFYATTAGLSVLGLVLLRLLDKIMTHKTLTTILLILDVVIAFAILIFGQLSPLIFFGCICLYQISATMIRPYAFSALFDLHTSDTGAASSMLNSSFTVIGLLGLFPVIAIGGNYIIWIASLLLVGLIVSGSLWIGMLRSGKVPEGLTKK
jgi:DHA1 family bicyclomycin/chloramphenicol resistance-like MFS transporter